jgi:lysophospholipase L1-like esterase
MHPLVLHFASGDALFSGAALMLVSLWLRWAGPWRHRPRTPRLLHVVGWIVVALSATPLPWLVYAVWLLLDVLAWRGRTVVSAAAPLLCPMRAAQPAAIILVLAITSVIGGWELASLFVDPRWTGPHDHTYVIGDSLSAGAGEESPPWPDRLADRGFHVTNLARPGATIRSALAQADRIPTTAGSTLILVEIGGNDLLSGRSADEFERDLAALLDHLHGPGRTVALLELPLYPGANAYGAAQRRQCRLQHLPLISKRVLARALSGSGQTLDGLHLSASGHESLADWFAARLVRTGQ